MRANPVFVCAHFALPVAYALVLFSLTLPAKAADTCGTSTDDAAAATSQRMLQALVETNGVPGMGASVWRDGQVVWIGCAGWRDLEAREPVRRNTAFRLASVSKVIAATAAAKLAEEGRLDIDAPVGKTLPWLPPAWAPVTVRQLASHTSGAPHYAGDDLDVLGRMRYPTARDAVGIFSGRALLSSPGTTYSYSSWGYTLLGAMIEASSGEHFLDYVRHHITDELTIAADGDLAESRTSRLYDIEDGAVRRMPQTDMSYTWPGGGLAATPEAIATFGGRMLENRIVGTERWQAMQQPVRLSNGDVAHERDYDVGFGWRLGRDPDGNRIVHHAGITTGARSMLMLWPDQNSAASVLSNAAWVSAMESTVGMLAAPFRPQPVDLVTAACPSSGRMAATLDGVRFDVMATFRIERDRCIGELIAPASLLRFFANAYQWPGHRLRIIALTSDGKLSRAALVTPYGLYDLRALRQGSWAARLNANSTLELAG